MRDPREQSLVRAIGVLTLLAIGIPVLLHALFERQARRLEALGDHGAPVVATVTEITSDGSVAYAYVVDGERHEWSVAPDRAPHSVGATFEAHYLPEDASFSRPDADRTAATREAAENRRNTTMPLLAIFWFFGMFAAINLNELREMRRIGIDAYMEGQARGAWMRRRLFSVGLVLVPILLAIGAWHLRDADAHGESPIAPILGMVLAFAVIGGTLAYALREGVAHAPARGARLARWAAPIAIVVAVLRLLLFLFGGDIG